MLFPSWHQAGQYQSGRGRLPVLLDPYGGPHAQRVLRARGAYLVPQWFAEQGFAVVIADGRGTPARGPAWERAVAGDLADPVLEDQVDALAAAADRFGDLDTGRVAIRGWSFGGYLAALAVLRRPDVFHAAIAGAPVTDWRLYDTHYTERYLGLPGSNAEAYDRSGLISLAERSVVSPRPLMLIHGLADDNVVVAHTLRLSAALLAAGYPHQVLPLTGITHMASQETVAENLLLLQLDFLRHALGVPAPGGARSNHPRRMKCRWPRVCRDCACGAGRGRSEGARMSEGLNPIEGRQENCMNMARLSMRRPGTEGSWSPSTRGWRPIRCITRMPRPARPTCLSTRCYSRARPTRSTPHRPRSSPRATMPG